MNFAKDKKLRNDVQTKTTAWRIVLREMEAMAKTNPAVSADTLRSNLSRLRASFPPPVRCAS